MNISYPMRYFTTNQIYNMHYLLIIYMDLFSMTQYRSGVILLRQYAILAKVTVSFVNKDKYDFDSYQFLLYHPARYNGDSILYLKMTFPTLYIPTLRAI